MAKKIPFNVNKTIDVSLVKQVSKSGERICYFTIGREAVYPNLNLNKQRWDVEEAYKRLKACLDVIHFSGKYLKALQQDFYTNVFFISLTSIHTACIMSVRKRKKK